MKTTSLRFCCALLVLGVLGAIVPSVRAEDPVDRVAETGQYQAQLFQETVQEYQDLRQSADEMSSLRQDAIDQAPTQPVELPNQGPGAQPAAPVVIVPHAVAGAVAAPPFRLPAQAVQQPPPLPFDPVAFQQMVRQNQERVRQTIRQTQQQVIQRQQEIIQQHQMLVIGLHQ